MKSNSTSTIPSGNKNQNGEQLRGGRRWDCLLISLSLAFFVTADLLERMGGRTLPERYRNAVFSAAARRACW